MNFLTTFTISVIVLIFIPACVAYQNPPKHNISYKSQQSKDKHIESLDTINVLIQVNDYTLSMEEFLTHYLESHQGIHISSIKKFFQQYQERFIDKILTIQWAKDFGLVAPKIKIDTEIQKYFTRSDQLNKSNQLKKVPLPSRTKMKEMVEQKVTYNYAHHYFKFHTPIPSIDELKQFYQENKKDFRMPETRETYLFFTYSQRKDFNNEVIQIDEVYQLLENKVSITEIKEKYPSLTIHKTVKRNDLETKIDQQLFNLKETEYGPIINTPHASFLVYCHKIKPEHQIKFDHVKKNIHSQLFMQKLNKLKHIHLDPIREKAVIKSISKKSLEKKLLSILKPLE